MADEEKEKKKIKIRRMNLDQMNEALEKTQKNMGGFWSCYGKALSARRELAVAAGKTASKKA
jgi:hypothetical protein